MERWAVRPLHAVSNTKPEAAANMAESHPGSDAVRWGICQTFIVVDVVEVECRRVYLQYLPSIEI